MLSKIDKTLRTIGINSFINKPIFYNSNIGIRFKIGEDITSKTYLKDCYTKVKTLYKEFKFDALVIEIYTNKFKTILEKLNKIGIGKYDYHYTVDFDDVKHYFLVYDLANHKISTIKLLKEILKSNLGGDPMFSSSIYFLNTTDNILFYLYDDRGLDIVSDTKEKLIDIYDKYHDWILPYDKDKIDKMFK